MKALLPLIALSLAACSTLPNDPAPSEVTVRVGEPARLGSINLRVTRIVEDSRCSAQVQCVWAGRLRVAVIADDPAALMRANDPQAPARMVARELEMTLGHPPVPLINERVTLVAATPEPDGQGPIPAEAYRLTFRRS